MTGSFLDDEAETANKGKGKDNEINTGRVIDRDSSYLGGNGDSNSNANSNLNWVIKDILIVGEVRFLSIFLVLRSKFYTPFCK